MTTKSASPKPKTRSLDIKLIDFQSALSPPRGRAVPVRSTDVAVCNAIFADGTAVCLMCRTNLGLYDIPGLVIASESRVDKDTQLVRARHVCEKCCGTVSYASIRAKFVAVMGGE